MTAPQRFKNHEFSIKEGDRLPWIDTILLDGRCNPIDLTNALSVKLNMTLSVHPRTIVLDGATAGFDADETGHVWYEWDTDDTTTAGDYKIEWLVEYVGPRVVTVPSQGNDIVHVNPRVA
jgi:hypothetical protein